MRMASSVYMAGKAAALGVLNASNHYLLEASIAERRSSALAEVPNITSGSSNANIHDFMLIFISCFVRAGTALSIGCNKRQTNRLFGWWSPFTDRAFRAREQLSIKRRPCQNLSLMCLPTAPVLSVEERQRRPKTALLRQHARALVSYL
jgi:hypothetical protein